METVNTHFKQYNMPSVRCMINPSSLMNGKPLSINSLDDLYHHLTNIVAVVDFKIFRQVNEPFAVLTVVSIEDFFRLVSLTFCYKGADLEFIPFSGHQTLISVFKKKLIIESDP